MLMDKNLMFHDDTAVTTAATYKGSSLPLEVTGAISKEQFGEPMEIVVLVTEVFDAGGTSVDIQFCSANDAAMTTLVVQASTGALTDPALGTIKKFPLELVVADGDATHIGVALVSLGTYTTGKVSAWLQRAGENQASYEAY